MSCRITWSSCRSILILLLLCAAGGSHAARSLYWKSLDVDAELDAGGSLHVSERHHMVFTGEWNGGERIFRVGSGQRMVLKGMYRVDPDSESRQPLANNRSLSGIDQYHLDGKQLRWRARMTGDPPFSATGIIYEIDYVLENILNRNGDDYWLAHDFAFPDRRWPIRQFTLDLDLDENWHGDIPWSGRLSRSNLQPGDSVTAHIPLRYQGSDSPAATTRFFRHANKQAIAAPLYQRIAVVAGLLLTLFLFARRFYNEEKAQGIFEPLMPPESVTTDWLKTHVFSQPPEVVGAAWDEQTGTPEVVALLARMEQEGKLSSQIVSKRRFFLTRKSLALGLLVPVSELAGYEQRLAKKLFFNGDSTTTDQIRKHYRSTGFDPAETIRSKLKRRVDRLVRDRHKGMYESYKRTVFLFLALIPLALITIMLRNSEMPMLAVAAVTALPLFLIARTNAGSKMKVAWPPGTLLAIIVPMLIHLLVIIGLILVAPQQASLMFMLSLAVFSAGLFSSVLNGAQIIDSRARIELRRRLVTAREYFRNELKQKNPALEDGWLPYVLAFGLGPDMDRWFRAFGSSSPGAVSTGIGTPGGGISSGGSWSGGGGSFGGAGSSGAWVSAASSIANGVSSPGSSGGGFSGGGSGGGGGGGW